MTIKRNRWRLKHFSIYVWIVALLVNVISPLVQVQTTHAAPGDVPTFSVVGTHPQANAQSTYYGKVIGDMAVSNGKLYAAYGDYDANTGPIHINPFDLTTETFDGSVLSMPTEEVMALRTINGKLYAPWADPQLPWTSNVGFSSNESGTWQNYAKTPAVHIFDMATLDGNDLWMVGASVEPDGVTDRGATAFRSTDGGATWNVVQTDISTPTATGFERYYWVAALNGKIYMQAGGIQSRLPAVQIFDGTSWTTGTTKQICKGNRPNMTETIGNYIVCADGTSASLSLYDGSTVHTVKSSVGAIYDFYKDGGYLYALGLNGIARTTNGDDWQIIGATSDVVRPFFGGSLAVYNDHIYIGTTLGKIYKSNQSISEMTYEPLIKNVSPNGGIPINKASTIQISGVNFDPNGTVVIGDKTVTAIYDSYNSSIEVPAPISTTVKSVDITVTNSNGASYTLSNGLRYFDPNDPTQYNWSHGAGLNNDDPSYWYAPVVSADGSKVLTLNRSYLYGSSNAGESFSIIADEIGSGAAISADGLTVLSSTEDSGYLQVSKDSGKTWRVINSLGSAFWSSLSVSGDGQVLYAYSFGGLDYTDGTFRSTDGGDSWHKIDPLDDDANVAVLQVSEDGQHVAGIYNNNEIIYSHDGGATWTKHDFGIFALDDIFMSADGQTMIAYSSFDEASYKSIDGGATWNQITLPHDAIVGCLTGSSDANHLVAVGTDYTVYISSNGGITWQDVEVDNSVDGDGYVACATSSANGQIVYLTLGGYLYKSSDGGLTWQKLHADGLLPAPQDLAMSPDGKYMVVLSGNYEHPTVLYLFDDYGRHYVKSLDVPAGEDSSYGRVVISDDGQKLALSFYDSETIYLSDDGGETWHDSGLHTGYGWDALSASSDMGVLLAASYESESVYLSRDGGSTWQEQTAISGQGQGWFGASVSPDGKKLLVYNSSNEVYTSDDNGLTISKLLDTPEISPDGWFSSVVASNSTIFAVHSDVLWMSKDGGETWIKALEMPEDVYLNNAFISRNGQVMVANADTDGIYVSIDSGQHWSLQTNLTTAVAYIALSGNGKTIVGVNYDHNMPFVGTQKKAPSTGGTSSPKPPKKPSKSASSQKHTVSTQVTNLLYDVFATTLKNNKVKPFKQVVSLNDDQSFVAGSSTTLELNSTKMYQYKLNDTSYTFRLSHADEDYVIVKITPGGEVRLQKNAKHTYDLDGDGNDDITMELMESGDGTARLAMQLITKPQTEGQPHSDFAAINQGNRVISPVWIGIIAGVGFVLLAGIFFFIIARKRRHSHDDNQYTEFTR